MKINSTTPLNLIPRFDETQPLLHAASKGHHILVPLGADDDINSEPISLPTINKDGQIKALIKSGVLEENAEKFSRESRRNITILKKLLGFTHTRAKWVDKENVREIIPALLIGRWNETFVGDLELIEKLSGQKYADYLAILRKWKNFEESPLIQIGETWRLTSPLDLWTNLAQLLTQKDFQNLNECFSLAFKSGNPVIEPKSKDDLFAMYNKPRKYSSWSREGLAQSLILVGRLGEGLSMPNLPNPQLWVDAIIVDLLSNASAEIWISVDHELPLISEASPASFLKALGNSLSKDQPEIIKMFLEEDGLLHKTSHHTGLLWALEGLAWLPEYLRESSLLLLRLAQIDPGGSLSNRPINSISEIFRPWHYQTLASFEERFEVLKYITGKEKEAGWALLVRMLPDNHGIARPTHKMRWKMFDKNTNLSYTYQEIWKTHSYVVELLFNMFDKSEQKFSQLIDAATKLSPNDRKTVFDWAESAYTKVEQKEFMTWETIRKILNQHRSYPDTDWALPESELARLEDLYYKLQPPNLISRYSWLFNDHWPAFIEGFQANDEGFEKRHEQRERKVLQARNEAISLFLKEVGLEKTLELRKQVKETWALGDALARDITKPEDVLIVSKCLNDDIQYQKFVQGFFFRKCILEGFEWIKSIVMSLQETGLNSKALSNLLIPLEPSKQLWDFISLLDSGIQTEYWQNVYPRFYHIPTDEKIIGLEKLMEYKRYFSAVDITSQFTEEIPTNLLTALLTKAATEKSREDSRFKGYEIERIFESLDKRTDVEKSVLIHLEWLYLPFFDSYGTRRNPKNLEEELAKSPGFFVEVLKWVFVPKEKERMEDERKGFSDEQIQNRAKQAYHLLHSWKRIPGMRHDNSIDEVELMAWVTKARELAKEASRIDVADMQIGQVLAQFPENTPHWPQEKIFQVIEEINTDSLKRNYSVAMFNKRGFSFRGAFEGGGIEREKASYFKKLADDFMHKYPNVAEIFRKIEQGYFADAKRMDESAEREGLEY